MGLLENLLQRGQQQPYYDAVPQNVNIGEEIRRLMHRQDMSEAMSSATPFLMTAALSWPSVWLYRGIDWHTKKGKMTLPLYIRQTFFQAKAIQFAVLGVGLIYTFANTPKRL